MRDSGATGGAEEPVVGVHDRDCEELGGYVQDAAELRFAWYHRVLPLLGEYFHNDGERLRAVLGSDLVRAREVSADARRALGYLYDPESPPYEIVRLDGDNFLTALRRLAGGAVDIAEA